MSDESEPTGATTDTGESATVASPSGVDALRARLPETRAEAEALLDRLVRENRFTIAVLFPLVGAVSLVGSAEGWVPDPLAFNPWFVLFGVLVMRSPLVVGVLPTIDRRAVGWLGVLIAYTYAIEAFGVATGWPYGSFEYTVSLGPMVGGVPAALPVFFIPLVMNAYLLCVLLLGPRASNGWLRLLTVIPAVVAMDVVLDPGAVALGFWSFGGGAFYGVPLSNYAGWVLSAAVAVVTLDRAFDLSGLRERLADCEFMLDDMVSFVILWGGINLWYGNLLPVAVAGAFGLGLVRSDRFDAALFNPLS
ncbi:carotene biosynthesis associated membrane protein [Halorubrum aidingense JCM 13560]|uniref:Carotene biosynthesis associated membrane protein n=1 Tax=Halorubrum aidingense JCM 13560 TaxID=1230454 RepID=M0PAF1_9EURY|nr:bisanhydrobacterioruberin hydratase [Halorubrum aidingense]EMA66843.1 carotene biosynthesis associated membrane protein [Halorubrum aidingense JCM 13560]